MHRHLSSKVAGAIRDQVLRYEAEFCNIGDGVAVTPIAEWSTLFS
jgi:hypothetical protein